MRKISLGALGSGVAMFLLGSAGYGQTSTFNGSLSGTAESPPVVTTASGNATVTYNATAHTLAVNLTFAGLIGGPASAAHIHCCVTSPGYAGVAVPFTGFPATASGTYNHSFDLTMTATYSATFVGASGGTAAGAEAALASGLASGTAYADIHDATFPGGEIRAFLAPAVADLAITKDDGVTQAAPGQVLTYTIVVTNAGPSPVAGAIAADSFPAALTVVSYTSAASGGATGNTAVGTGNISDTLNLPVGSGVTYKAVATVSSSFTGTLSNTATITPPAGVTDPNLGNNTATDTDTVFGAAIPTLDPRGVALLVVLLGGLGLLLLRKPKAS